MAGAAKRATGKGKKKTLKDPLPPDISPMLATLSDRPFSDSDWLYEVKWDGYRIIATVKDKEVRLSSRGGLNFTKVYTPVVQSLQKLDIDCVLDGEIVVLNEEGKPDFDALQSYKNQPIVYYVFDVLWSNGESHLKKSLVERKKILAGILPGGNDVVRYSEDFDDGIGLFEHVEALELEGIIAKKKSSLYSPGKRSREWLKLPTAKRQQFVIGGWSESESGRAFRSLIFGYYEHEQLMYVGHAGGGYKEKEMKSILTKLQNLEITKCPFKNKVDVEGALHWIKPELVAEIKYSALTKSGKIRKPAIFLGFLKDKKASEIVKQLPAIKPTATKQRTSTVSNWAKVDDRPITSEETFKIEEFEIKLQNVEEQLWVNVMRADLIRYYHAVSPYMLPHLRNRPQSMHLKLAGPTRPGFYIKDMENRQPAFARIFSIKRKHKKEDRREIIDYLLCQNVATLLYMINLGCIDINPWTATINNPTQPDYLVVDLDPSDESFKKVIDTAFASKQLFDKLKLKVFPKTSGKTGMHFLIPCCNLSFRQARTIAENICTAIHELVPSFTTTELTVSRRGSNLYIDPNQNDEADTIAAPYSVRPWKLPSVSTPVEWKEIRADMDPYDFNIDTIIKRIERKGELFSELYSARFQLSNTKALLKHMF